MKHMGLFEGIGGFSLAARWAGWNTPVMVEWDTYCQAVLNKNFPDATIFSDIRNFDGRPYAGQIDIITGGFPCQPFSHAGKRNGADDDRYLWPEMLRVIREVAPSWVVGENVAGLLSMDGGRVFAGILADLGNAGYCTETYLIPAVAVGAPHRRDRVWIVAHRDRIERNGRGRTWNGRAELANENCGVVANAKRWNGQDARHGAKPGGIRQRNEYGNLFDGCCWSEHWHEVATRICRVDDGVSEGVDGTTEIPSKKNTGKAHRLEALGNAIVPQIAYQIFDAINQYKL